MFLTVTLPLSGPGIVAGLTTAFAWTFSAFATPQLVGGGKVNMVSNLVYQLGFANFNFPVRGERFASPALALTYVVDRRHARPRCGRSKRSGCIDGKRLSRHALARCAAGSLVVAILGFIILPAFVVGDCGIQRQGDARLPAADNCRCAGSHKAINYRDFQLGF